ncbi:MAG: hypothetical protein HMLKMBBP_01236 [Planctomycetes bacterium]|nr:hypothetical protein [Planctomycetota bacterium]
MTASDPQGVPASVPGVCEVLRFGARGQAPALLFEVPHGATRRAHFDALRARMRGEFPEGLEDFFFVNTDVGATEYAAAAAEAWCAAAPGRAAVVLRSEIPRTLIDCNRIVDRATRPSATSSGQMTPGVASYVRDPRDLALLLDLHAAYTDAASRAFDAVCGGGGRAVMAHTYAPRSLDVPVDDRIVERLRTEYRPENIGRWPLRAEVDLITTAPDGAMLADPAVVSAARAAFFGAGLRVAENEAYALHPASQAHAFAARFPGRTLCIEVRRDLLVRDFTPFDEMEIDPAKAERIGRLLAAAL